MFKYNIDNITKFTRYIPNEEEIKNELLIAEGNLFANQQVTKISNEWHYYKLVLRETEILNELIGTYLAKYINLDTVEYIIGKEDGSTRLAVLSKNFRKKGIKYLCPEETFIVKENIEYNFRNKIICDTKYLDKIPKEIKTELLKLIILDIYMGQFDRHTGNIMFKEEKKNISLAPVFDYGNSFAFDSTVNCYSNPFLTISMNEKGIEKFLLKYPFSYQTMYKLIQLDIEDVLKEIEKLHNIEISDDTYNYYRNEKSIKLLTKFK